MSAEAPQFNVRIATASDHSGMGSILELAQMARDGRKPSESGNLNIQLRLAVAGAWACIAEDRSKDELAGFIIGNDVPDMPDAEHISYLMCSPDYWGRGIGGLLLNKSVEVARSKDKRQIFLWAGVTNFRARALYERNGYELAGRQRTSENQGVFELYRLILDQDS